jgi:UDP-galactopyranose mutase
MLNHERITVMLNTEWTDVTSIPRNLLVFTGPIDQYFKGSGLPPLQYRSINFEWARLPNSGFYQPNSVVNYPLGSSGPVTRCVEYKHFLNQKSDYTIIAKETTCDNGEPYYPIPTTANSDLYKRYAILAAGEKGVHFVGRLANYKYFNMDGAIRNAMDYFNEYIMKDLQMVIDDTPELVVTDVAFRDEEMRADEA